MNTICIRNPSILKVMLYSKYENLRLPNGLRYPLVGGTRQRRFAGTDSKPRKLPENAQTPTTMAPMLVGVRVHAVLGCFCQSFHHG